MRKSLLISTLLHAAIIGLMVADIDWFAPEPVKNPPAILMVDLTKVQIADKTNLPQKIEKKQPAKTETKPKEVKKETPKPEVKPEPKPQEKPAPKNAAKVKTAEKKQDTQKNKKAEQKPQKKKESYDFKSLLASVEQVRKAPTPTQQEKPDENAITGGEEVNLTQILTISERDLIAYKLKECWNVDAGIEGAEDIVIDIQASINKDGRVRDVKIKNNLTSAAMKSVAESARRAILICDQKGDESPFKILADRYGTHYNQWKELELRFNPLEGSVF